MGMNDAREMSADRHRQRAYELINEAEERYWVPDSGARDREGASWAATLALAHLAAADARAEEGPVENPGTTPPSVMGARG